jgi:hypothetical protein
MLINTHLELSKQWEAALNEICMMMGTTLMNAVLHKMEIVEEPYDQNHTDRPEPLPEEKLSPDVKEMIADLYYIEKMRKLHTRGWDTDKADTEKRALPEWDPAVMDHCIERLQKIKGFTEKVCKG